MDNLLSKLKIAFATLNQEFFNNQLPIPAFVVGKRKGVLHFDAPRYQIVIGRDFRESSVALVLGDLLHQMCHISNKIAGIKDHTENDYHNRNFVRAALNVGLVVSKCKKKGAITGEERGEVLKPSEELQRRKETVFRQLEKVLAQEDLLKVKLVNKKKYFLKYVCACPPPHNSIRSGRHPDGQHQLNTICLDCGQIFKCVDRHGRNGDKINGNGNGTGEGGD